MANYCLSRKLPGLPLPFPRLSFLDPKSPRRGPHSSSEKAKGGVEEPGRAVLRIWRGAHSEVVAGILPPISSCLPPPLYSSPSLSSCVNRLPLQAHFMEWRPQRTFYPQNVSTRKPIKPPPSFSAKKTTFFPPLKTLSQEFDARLLYFPISQAVPFPLGGLYPSLPTTTCPPDRSLLFI